MTCNSIVEEFKKCASSVSFHYADDSCKEWGLAKKGKKAVFKLWDDNPELHDEMLEVMSKQLWAREFKSDLERRNDL